MAEAESERRPVPGWPGYLAGSDGRIWTLRKRGFGAGRQYDVPREKKQTHGGRGYMHVSLRRDGRQFCVQVHRLVLLAFGGEPQGAYPFVHARHLNGNALDNRASNLAWGTPLDNMADQYRHGTRRRRTPVTA